ncbi:suppression of tumorigenicity 5 st5 [Anaeramoeba flamelloides]|uniref:Suppression of tumorigenicity 5 st5 n=1 Tax=Anaeramoeba flamelloides TaxID=1746091 RepID=A0ABQ8XPD7_9EUKA|nr:suppression of tumorigenicity 5 st5 [Anaeramoeba flamelloides]
MSYLKKNNFTPPHRHKKSKIPKFLKRKKKKSPSKNRTKGQKKKNEKFCVDELTEEKRLNPFPAQPWLRRPEKFYESFFVCGAMSDQKGSRCETVYSYPHQPKELEASVSQFCFPEGLGVDGKKFTYGGEHSNSIPKYEKMIGSELEHFIFMLSNHESLLYGHCVKVWYPLGFLPSFVEKVHPLWEKKKNSKKEHIQEQENPNRPNSKNPNKSQNKNENVNCFQSRDVNQKDEFRLIKNKKANKKKKNAALKWASCFKKSVRSKEKFALVPLCFCLLSKTSFIELNFEILHSIIAYTSLQLLTMKIFRNIHFSDDTLRRILIVKEKRNNKKLYSFKSFDFKKSKRNSQKKRNYQKINRKKSIGKHLSISAPTKTTITPANTLTTIQNPRSTSLNNLSKRHTIPQQNNEIILHEMISIDKSKLNEKNNCLINKRKNQICNKNIISSVQKIIEKEKEIEIEREKEREIEKEIEKEKEREIEKEKEKDKEKDKEKEIEIKLKKQKEQGKRKKNRAKPQHLIIEFLQNLKNLNMPHTKKMMFLSIGGGLKNLNYIIPNDLESCQANFSFKWLFSILSLENILEIVRFTLLEKSIDPFRQKMAG